jgi:hypothetical protein
MNFFTIHEHFFALDGAHSHFLFQECGSLVWRRDLRSARRTWAHIREVSRLLV